MSGSSWRMDRAATSPSSVCVGGIRMSTTATSGPVQPDAAQQPGGILRLADDVDAGLLEQVDDSLPGEQDVVGDDYAHGISARLTAGTDLQRAAQRADSVGRPHQAARGSRPSSSTATTSTPSLRRCSR